MVDDMTGQPLPQTVDAVPVETAAGLVGGSGLRLRNIQAARIPGPIGAPLRDPFKLPVYRISP